MKKLVIASLFVIGSVALAASSVNAEVLGEQEQEQDVEQTIEWKCNPKTTTTTGAYGESTTTTDNNCEASTAQNVNQRQRQQILGDNLVLRDEGKIHLPVDTALDTKTTASMVGIMTIGSLAYVVRKKIA